MVNTASTTTLNGENEAKPHTPLEIALGVASLCVSGFSYAVVGVAIRYGVSGRTTIAFTLSVNGGVGVLCLGAIAFTQIGVNGVAATTSQQWGVMLWRASSTPFPSWR